MNALLTNCFSRTCENPASKKPGRTWFCDECADRMEAINDQRRKESEQAPKARCPTCGAKMVVRRGPVGPFYGCSKFPNCKGSRSIK